MRVCRFASLLTASGAPSARAGVCAPECVRITACKAGRVRALTRTGARGVRRHSAADGREGEASRNQQHAAVRPKQGQLPRSGPIPTKRRHVACSVRTPAGDAARARSGRSNGRRQCCSALAAAPPLNTLPAARPAAASHEATASLLCCRGGRVGIALPPSQDGTAPPPLIAQVIGSADGLPAAGADRTGSPRRFRTLAPAPEYRVEDFGRSRPPPARWRARASAAASSTRKPRSRTELPTVRAAAAAQRIAAMRAAAVPTVRCAYPRRVALQANARALLGATRRVRAQGTAPGCTRLHCAALHSAARDKSALHDAPVCLHMHANARGVLWCVPRRPR